MGYLKKTKSNNDKNNDNSSNNNNGEVCVVALKLSRKNSKDLQTYRSPNSTLYEPIQDEPGIFLRKIHKNNASRGKCPFDNSGM
jgi:hypothetical protein